MKRLFLASIAALLLATCTKDGDTIYEPDPKDQASGAPLITVLYAPDGIGDQSYSDLVYQGVEEAAVMMGLRTLHLSPITGDGGRIFLEQTIAEMSAAADTVRRLLIVASTLYDEEVRQNCQRLEANPRADLLYLDTRTPLRGKGSTLYMPYYGAMYAAGAIAPIVAGDVLLLGANPKNEAVVEAMQGFSDGFRSDLVLGGFPAEKVLVSRYIAEENGDGFSVADSTALLIMAEAEDDFASSTRLLMPVCGGAANTFYRLIEMIGGYQYVGVDSKKTSARCHYSVVKHVDSAVVRTIDRWFSGEGMPKHQALGMADGYTDVILHPYGTTMQEAFEELLTDEKWKAIREEAIRKEKTCES
jgi:basic membrane protein A